ncbi:MAG: hypothetical protein ABIH38_02525 [Patescibacteria group bacterium]
MRKNKELAIKFRKAGLSYNEISKKLKIPKSTLSYWFGSLTKYERIKLKNIDQAKEKWAANITRYNKKRSLLARQNWAIIQKKSTKEIHRLNLRELKLVGASLYWAEGYKRGNWNIVFCNSDPAMIILIMRFFKDVCGVPINKIRTQIQIHRRISAVSATRYWSKITKLPARNFLKPIRQISRASSLKRKNNLPYGTLRIKINDVKLLNKIKGWIVGLAK